MQTTRRQFLHTTLHLGAAALTLSACAEEGSGNPPNGSPDAGPATVVASINGNHGHVLTVSASDVETAVEKTYDITGAAGHTHSVTLSAADFGTLSDHGTVTTTTTTASGHSHTVTVVF